MLQGTHSIRQANHHCVACVSASRLWSDGEIEGETNEGDEGTEPREGELQDCATYGT